MLKEKVRFEVESESVVSSSSKLMSIDHEWKRKVTDIISNVHGARMPEFEVQEALDFSEPVSGWGAITNLVNKYPQNHKMMDHIKSENRRKIIQ